MNRHRFQSPSRRTSKAKAGVLLVAALALTGLLATPAAGHAIVRSTDPDIDEVVQAPPDAVTMEFNEPVEIAFGALRVFNTSGQSVEAGTTEYLPGRPDAVTVPLPQDLSNGTYTVTWRIVSADGHPIQEAFVFHVGAPGENPRGVAAEILAGQSGAGPLAGTLAGVGRWVGFLALLLLTGTAVFLVLVWRLPRTRTAERPEEVERRFDARWRRILVWSWVAAVVTTVALYVLQGSVAADVPLSSVFSGGVLLELAETRYGLVSLVRLGLLLLAAGLWLAVRTSLRPAAARSVGAAAAPQRLPWWVLAAGAVLAVALLASPGVAGHAGTTEPLAANVAADTVHMLGAAVWVGGLVILVAAAFPAVRILSDRDRLTTLAPVVARFSDTAMVAVGLLVASGVFRAWLEIRAWRALTGATYGIVLLTKIGAFLPLLALGAINNRWTKPRISRAAQEGAPGKAPLRTLRRLVTAEIALVTVVVAITAFLVNLPPARVEAGVVGPFIGETRLGEHKLSVLVEPNQVGRNTVHLSLTEPHGAPVHEAEEVRVLFRMPSKGIGPLVAEAEREHPGRFMLHGHQLSIPGEWVLEIVIRLGEFEEQRTTMTVHVNP
ncbi:MAG TPA: CopD family protein [Actinomycetota bacterium]|nr:CopD family protein [Actinomycetota bacterium]